MELRFQLIGNVRFLMDGQLSKFLVNGLSERVVNSSF